MQKNNPHLIRFKPPGTGNILSARKFKPEKLAKIRRSIEKNQPMAGKGVSLADLNAVEPLAKMRIPGIQLLPAMINTKGLSNVEPPSIAPIGISFEHPSIGNSRLQATSHVMRLPDGVFVIDAYGMQGSSKRSAFPKEFRGVYDSGAPTLALGLTAAAAEHMGAKRVLLAGSDVANLRKSYKRPEMAEILRNMSKIIPKKSYEEHKAIAQVLDNWDKLSEEEVYKILKPHKNLVVFGLPPNLINRYYKQIPARFNTKIVTYKNPRLGGKELSYHEIDLGQVRPLRAFMESVPEENTALMLINKP